MGLLQDKQVNFGAQHREIDQLVHLVAETSFQEILRTGALTSSVIIWTDNSKTKKIRECIFTRTNGLVSQVVTKQYDDTGALVETYTQDITRSIVGTFPWTWPHTWPSSGFVSSITGTLTQP